MRWEHGHVRPEEAIREIERETAQALARLDGTSPPDGDDVVEGVALADDPKAVLALFIPTRAKR